MGPTSLASLEAGRFWLYVPFDSCTLTLVSQSCWPGRNEVCTCKYTKDNTLSDGTTHRPQPLVPALDQWPVLAFNQWNRK